MDWKSELLLPILLLYCDRMIHLTLLPGDLMTLPSAQVGCASLALLTLLEEHGGQPCCWVSGVRKHGKFLPVSSSFHCLQEKKNKNMSWGLFFL